MKRFTIPALAFALATVMVAAPQTPAPKSNTKAPTASTTDTGKAPTGTKGEAKGKTKGKKGSKRKDAPTTPTK